MASLYTKVKLYLEANSKTISEFDNNIRLQDDSNGNGSYIHTWSVDSLAKPTDEQLTSYEDVGNTEEALNVILSNRRNAYPPIGDQLDMQYWDKVNDTSTWQDAVAEVKSDFPKP